MQIGDLVRYLKAEQENILIVVSIKEKRAGKQAMVRCFVPHMKEFYWFWEDHLEAVCK
tara:strand:+ start:59 stop:232 length:174 start_codon:yes stop_codon:yes gene_type:complete